MQKSISRTNRNIYIRAFLSYISKVHSPLPKLRNNSNYRLLFFTSNRPYLYSGTSFQTVNTFLDNLLFKNFSIFSFRCIKQCLTIELSHFFNYLKTHLYPKYLKKGGYRWDLIIAFFNYSLIIFLKTNCHLCPLQQ